jgi:hypothetical protein
LPHGYGAIHLGGGIHALQAVSADNGTRRIETPVCAYTRPQGAV